MLDLRLAAGILVVAAVVLPGQSLATPIIDQDTGVTTSEIGSSVGSSTTSNVFAQVLTGGVAGDLVRVDLHLRVEAGATEDPWLEIRGVDEMGLPGDASSVRATIPIPLADVPVAGFNDGIVPPTVVDLSSAGIEIVPGERLAFVLLQPPGGVRVFWEALPPYPGGVAAFSFQGGAWQVFDLAGLQPALAIRTWVEPASAPEPSLAVLLAATGLALGAASPKLRRSPAA